MCDVSRKCGGRNPNRIPANLLSNIFFLKNQIIPETFLNKNVIHNYLEMRNILVNKYSGSLHVSYDVEDIGELTAIKRIFFF